MHHNPNVFLKPLRLNICQDERFPDFKLPEIVEQGIRKDMLNSMLRCVSSSIACCMGNTEMIEQSDQSTKLMCYCPHRKMWYTQVGDITISEGPAVCSRIHLAHMLNNDIRSAERYHYKRHLEENYVQERVPSPRLHTRNGVYQSWKTRTPDRCVRNNRLFK